MVIEAEGQTSVLQEISGDQPGLPGADDQDIHRGSVSMCHALSSFSKESSAFSPSSVVSLV
jgi:hypothetical protein